MNVQSLKFLVVALLAGATLIGAPAYAKDNGWYLGVSVGQSKAKDTCARFAGTGTTCDDTDVAVAVFGGYQVNPNVGVEVGYTELGAVAVSQGAATTRFEGSGFELAGVGIYPINKRFEIYGKLGLFRWNVGIPSKNYAGTDLTYALGLKFNFTSYVGMRVQWQKYKDLGNEATTGTSDVDVVSLGLVAKF